MSEGYGADQKEEEKEPAKEPAKEENASGDAKEETPEQETPELSLVSLEDLLDNAPETLLENMEKAEEIKLENALNSGDYFLKELSVSDSYYLDETPIDIHLEYKDAETKTLPVSKVADNTQTTNEVDKMDVAGSKEIDGCKLVIVDDRGIEIVKWTSGDKDSIKIKVGDKEGYRNLKATMDDKGNLHIGGLFHDQDYTLIERRPADGYVTANDITYQIKNVAMSAALPAPAPAEPVSGDAISVETPAPQEIVTTGVAISSIVAIKNEDGTYTDQLDDKTIMHDEETHIQLLKLDAKTGQALGGAKFTVTDSKGNVVMKFVTKDDDFDITGKLVVGETYTFTETSAPSGFLLAKPVKLKIKDTAKVQNAVIDRPNQAWSIDITYIPMKHGFLYLTAIIDWYSRCIVGWDVDDTLDTTMVINACKKAFKVAKPLIINSDQGSQFTSDKYIDFIRDNGIRQSMDGKSRWADNIMIERWFRSFKYEEAYLTEYANLKEAREAIGKYIYTYNFERCHQAIGNKRPAEVYYPAMLLDAARAAA